jgi:hypothetical protein
MEPCTAPTTEDPGQCLDCDVVIRIVHVIVDHPPNQTPLLFHSVLPDAEFTRHQLFIFLQFHYNASPDCVAFLYNLAFPIYKFA